MNCFKLGIISGKYINAICGCIKEKLDDGLTDELWSKHFNTLIYDPISNCLDCLISKKIPTDELLLHKGMLPKHLSKVVAVNEVLSLLRSVSPQISGWDNTYAHGYVVLVKLYAVYLKLYDQDYTLSKGLIM